VSCNEERLEQAAESRERARIRRAIAENLASLRKECLTIAKGDELWLNYFAGQLNAIDRACRAPRRGKR